MVKQQELKGIEKLRRNIAQMKKDLELLEIEERLNEGALIDRIEKGEKQERGPLHAGVETKHVAERVSWKEVVAKRCGPRVVDEELASRVTVPKKELIVLAEKAK
jgi:hypothetical protein